jgi:hypothetical protein
MSAFAPIPPGQKYTLQFIGGCLNGQSKQYDGSPLTFAKTEKASGVRGETQVYVLKSRDEVARVAVMEVEDGDM